MDNRIVNILNYIEENIGKPLYLNLLADKSCLSTFHFHRLFKKETGFPPKSFIENLKMEIAYQSVVYKGINGFEVSLNLGYNDYETFSRAFKKHFQISPDDLKAIVTNVQNQLENNSNEIVFVRNKTDNADEIAKKLEIKLEDKKYKNVPVANIKHFVIKLNNKENTIELNNSPKLIIKRKYIVDEDKKLWKDVLGKVSINIQN